MISNPVLQGLIPLGLFQTLWNNRCRSPDKPDCSVYRPTDLAAQLQSVGSTDGDWPVGDKHMIKASYTNAELWHQRFARVSGRRLKDAVCHVAGMPTDLPQNCSDHCTTCTMTQQKSKPVQKTADYCLATATRLSHVTWDLHGPNAIEGVAGAKYVAVAVDAGTAHTWVDILPNKKARTVAKSLTRYCCQVGIPGCVTTDNGQEFGRLFRELCDQKGTRSVRSEPYCPVRNGLVERRNSLLKRMSRSIIECLCSLGCRCDIGRAAFKLPLICPIAYLLSGYKVERRMKLCMVSSPMSAIYACSVRSAIPWT